MRIKEEQGFTLIELLVVVSIVGLLVAIAIPAFQEFKDKATNAEIESHYHNLRIAVEAGQTDAINPPTGDRTVLVRFNGVLNSATNAEIVTPGFPWSDIRDGQYVYARNNANCSITDSSCIRFYIFAGSCITGHWQGYRQYGDGRVLNWQGYSGWFDAQC